MKIFKAELVRPFKIRPVRAAGFRNKLVLSLASFALVVPLMSLPLGLPAFFVPAAPAAATSAEPSAAQVGRSDFQPVQPATLSADSADFSDAALNRSQSELNTEARVETVESRIEDVMTVETEPAEPELAAVDYDVYILADILNVRATPGTEGDIVAKITMGDRVHAIAQLGEWLQIEADDQIGFIKSEFATTSMVFRPVQETLYVKGTSLNVRDAYSTDGGVLANLDQGSPVTRLGIGDEWSKIELADGRIGYVSSKYLTKSSGRTANTSIGDSPESGDVTRDSDPATESSESVGTNPSGSTIVDLAYQAIGTPYVYGSESLKGMDCSGLVNWAYQQVGVSVPRSSASFGSAGEAVSLDEAQPGDVLCIDARPGDGKSRITHVAIYIGGGQVIHASTSQRRVVETSVGTFFDAGYSLLSVRRFPN